MLFSYHLFSYFCSFVYSSERKPGGPVSTFNGIGNVLRRKKLDQVSFSDSVQSDGIADEEAQQHKGKLKYI